MSGTSSAAGDVENPDEGPSIAKTGNDDTATKATSVVVQPVQPRSSTDQGQIASNVGDYERLFGVDEDAFEQPTTTRKELWSYYLYYNGSCSLFACHFLLDRIRT